MHQFFHNIALQNKKEMDAPIFYHLLAVGQLLMCVADAVSPFIRYLWAYHIGPKFGLLLFSTTLKCFRFQKNSLVSTLKYY